MPLLARRSIGDVAHGIDGFVRRPLVTRTCRPASGPAMTEGPPAIRRSTASAISIASAMRPTPASPRSAISSSIRTNESDAVGQQLLNISARRRMIPHARVHRGATRTGLSVASKTAVARSFACPVAILARRSAVAGATTIRSASRDNRCGRSRVRRRDRKGL